jgi:hypothetical protein
MNLIILIVRLLKDFLNLINNKMKKDLIDKIVESQSPLPLLALVISTLMIAYGLAWTISILIH